MKKIFLTACCLLSVVYFANAQKKTSGAIQFETTIDPAAMMASSGIQIPDQMKARMPSSSKSPYELLFNATNASYTPVEEIEDSNGAGGNRGGFGGRMMRMGGMGRDYYYTFADKKIIGVFDLTDTTYYMPAVLTVDLSSQTPSFRAGSDTAKVKAPAKPVIEIVKTDNTKKIIGFDCKEVIIKSTKTMHLLDADRLVTEQTHIWYTNDLGFDFSPNPSLWTEGAVLAIESNGNNTIAKSIEYRGVSNKDVTAPKKAKLITQEELTAKREAMMKMFRNNRPGGQGGTVRSIQIN